MWRSALCYRNSISQCALGVLLKRDAATGSHHKIFEQAARFSSFPGTREEAARRGVPYVSPARRRIAAFLQIALPISGISCLAYAFTHPDPEPLLPKKLPPELQYLAAQQTENENSYINWSGTHEVRPKRVFEPENEAEVEAFLRQASKANQRLRVIGSALSPNGLGLGSEGLLCMGLMDKILKVDTQKQQVTVQAGCKVQQVADALKPHGLTLQNFASIREQQIGGFTQVGAHGTGARIPPVDEQVVGLRLSTPGVGTVQLSRSQEPELFDLARVGLGSLGVVSQATLQCVPRHKLVEESFTTNIADVKKNHVRWLQEHKHLRYMWLPYTDTVVVVQCNPEQSTLGQQALRKHAHESSDSPATNTASNEEYQLEPLKTLCAEKLPETDAAGMSAMDMRDQLLGLDPVNQDWVISVNKAEAEFWKRKSGIRVGYNDEILGFDCGGEQWVLEVAFPVGELDGLKGTTKDIEYMERLMKEIKSHKIPAPSPIEQRWTCGSSSSMSPVRGSANEVFSWVGVIMYLPHEPELREKVTKSFQEYVKVVQEHMMPRFNATWHWAKLEVPSSEAELNRLRSRVSKQFPVEQLNAYRTVLDPRNVLANEWLDAFFPRN